MDIVQINSKLKNIIIKSKIKDYVKLEELHFMEHYLLSDFPAYGPKTVFHNGFTTGDLCISLEFSPPFGRVVFEDLFTITPKQMYNAKREQIIKELIMEREGRSLVLFNIAEYIQNNCFYFNYDQTFMTYNRYLELSKTILTSKIQIVFNHNKSNMKTVEHIKHLLNNMYLKVRSVPVNNVPYDQSKMLEFFGDDPTKVHLVNPSLIYQDTYPKVFIMVPKTSSLVLDAFTDPELNKRSIYVLERQEFVYKDYDCFTILKNDVLLSLLRINNLELKSKPVQVIYNYIQNNPLVSEFMFGILDQHVTPFNCATKYTKDNIGVIDTIIDKSYKHYTYDKKLLIHELGGTIYFSNAYNYLYIWFMFLTGIISQIGFYNLINNPDALGETKMVPHRVVFDYKIKIPERNNIIRVRHDASIVFCIYDSPKKVIKAIDRRIAFSSRRIAYGSGSDSFKNIIVKAYFVSDEHNTDQLEDELKKLIKHNGVLIRVIRDVDYDFDQLFKNYCPRLLPIQS